MSGLFPDIYPDREELVELIELLAEWHKRFANQNSDGSFWYQEDTAIQERVSTAVKELRSTTADVIDLIAEERKRQRIEKGYSKSHDSGYISGELAAAAACYAMPWVDDSCPAQWPWNPSSWKPRDRINNLLRAGALIVAEIERLEEEEMYFVMRNLQRRAEGLPPLPKKES